jgi:hypothetical protein
MTACDANDVAKSQAVRVLDVVLIGPLMVWGGFKLGGVAGSALAAFGASTIWYNARNYQRVAAALEHPPAA